MKPQSLYFCPFQVIFLALGTSGIVMLSCKSVVQTIVDIVFGVTKIKPEDMHEFAQFTIKNIGGCSFSHKCGSLLFLLMALFSSSSRWYRCHPHCSQFLHSSSVCDRIHRRLLWLQFTAKDSKITSTQADVIYFTLIFTSFTFSTPLYWLDFSLLR